MMMMTRICMCPPLLWTRAPVQPSPERSKVRRSEKSCHVLTASDVFTAARKHWSAGTRLRIYRTCPTWTRPTGRSWSSC
jgi:hypothetical protein